MISRYFCLAFRYWLWYFLTIVLCVYFIWNYYWIQGLMTSLKLEEISGIVGFFFSNTFKPHPFSVLWSSSFPKIYFSCSVIFTSDFYSFIPNFKKSFSSLPSPLLMPYSTSTVSLLYFIPCLAAENEAIVFQWCLFFFKKKKQLLSKSIMLALSFPGSLAE